VSREAIVGGAQRLFLERGFGAVSMDELAEAAGVARRTLYNQFARKDDIFREMLLRVSAQLETARKILVLHNHRNTTGSSAW
jgi:TetR/AcrR family transcriptional regulator, regulator of autoinduction and epiphytic fitness